jgi:hypothetical protein
MTDQAQQQTSSVRKIVTIVTEILLLDIRGYSAKANAEQLTIMVTLTDRIRQMVALLRALGSISVAELRTEPLLVGYVPTGDGAYLVLNPLYGGYGVLLAMALRNDLILINAKLGGILYDGVRVAAHLGPCLAYIDITDRVNFAGEGMNDCARILQARDAPGFPAAFTDEDFVVASSEAVACFDELYYARANTAQRRLMQCRRSEPFAVEDKHGCKHPVQLVEMHRNIALQPFKPVVSLSGEKRILMRQIAANRLPELPMGDLSAKDPIAESPDTAASPQTTSPQRRSQKGQTGNAEEKSLGGQEER